MNELKRKKLNKAEREAVYTKCNGHCAYCGKEISYKDMQVDHVVPLRNGGIDAIENMMPACRSCNHYKGTSSVETFREVIEAIPDKLERDSYIYKVGIRFGNVIPAKKKIVFYFEREEGGIWDSHS